MQVFCAIDLRAISQEVLMNLNLQQWSDVALLNYYYISQG